MRDSLDIKTEKDLPCDYWIETPVFFISRWDTTNPFQFHQDALNTFMVYSLLHLNADNTQIVLLDSRLSDGPFTIAWSHIFSSSHRLLDIRQLKNKIRKHSGNKNARLCFKRAVWGIHGGISPLHRGGTSRSRCKDAPLLHAFKDFMIGRIRTAVFGAADNLPWSSLKVPKMHQVQLDRDIEKLEHKLLAVNERITEGAKMRQLTAIKASVITITYAVRSAPVHNASALGDANVLKYPQQHGFDDDDPSSSRQPANNTKPISRQIQNDDEVQSRIRDAAQAWESQQRSQLRDIRVQFRAVNFGALSFIDQVAIAQGTDFFIGPHGASFAHLLYLRQLPKAAVLELRPPTRNIGNEQFRNLAVRMHHLYEKIPYGIGSRKPNVNLRVSRSELKDVLGTGLGTWANTNGEDLNFGLSLRHVGYSSFVHYLTMDLTLPSTFTNKSRDGW
ncbi:hypothetical protein BJ741DRAFT_653894 [Chytriomyces cf. hyalinus JEL632]|nr:hypothetical protein BJ741DRAFT_653894 [Chytriomyces cf. hyalinus JEL632]